MAGSRAGAPKNVVVHLWTADILFDMCLHVDEKVRNIDRLLPLEPSSLT
jgi:hypothetical protein